MHTPVLLQEVIERLAPVPGEFFIDGTLGAGGHAAEIIKRITPGGTFLGVDRDRAAIAAFKKRLTSQPHGLAKLVLAQSNYADLPEVLAQHQLPKADGLLLDLGFSSDQVEESNRGFSFRKDEPLLMTYDDAATPVHQILRELSEKELAKVLSEFGEERYANQIAKSIWQTAKNQGIETTGQLAELVIAAVPAGYEHGRIHPATRTFQALRIYANDELGHLTRLLATLPNILKSGSRIAIISFHSLEDRIVKQFFKEHQFRKPKRSWAGTGEQPKNDSAVKVVVGPETERELQLNIITKKPLVASAAELAANPRSRSAKLRVATLL